MIAEILESEPPDLSLFHSSFKLIHRYFASWKTAEPIFFQFQVYCLASMLLFSIFNHFLSLAEADPDLGQRRGWGEWWLFVACSASFFSVCNFFLTQNKGGGAGPPLDPPLLTPSNNLSVDFLDIWDNFIASLERFIKLWHAYSFLFFCRF